jgi:hypothetical protein
MQQRRTVMYVAVAALTALTFGVTAASAVSAQVALGVRYGQATGSGHYNVGMVEARLQLTGPLYATGAFEIMGGNWACSESAYSAIVCGYDGHTLALGGGVAILEGRRLSLSASAGAGMFERTGRYGGDAYRGSRHFTASAGALGGLRVVGPLWINVGVSHRRIFDALHERTAGEHPHLNALTFGVGVVFGRRDAP